MEDSDGFAKSQITSIIQTPDGYLWLGTNFGLFRFDGVRNVPWQPPAEQQLPSDDIFSLLAAHDGTLWIGTHKGLASWKDGKLTQYPELADRYIFALVEDPEGSVWASGVSVPTGKLCAIRNRAVQCYGEDGVFGRGVGLPTKKADEIFNAFFTTKPQGSGMGLAISRSIVESHGGCLSARANSGRGATFQFTLQPPPGN